MSMTPEQGTTPAEFVKSLKDTDKEFVRKMLEEFEEENHE